MDFSEETKELPFQARATQVAAFLRARIKSGEWEDAIPAERVLATQIGTSRTTLRSAFALLQQEGVVLVRSRRGTTVKEADSRGGRGRCMAARSRSVGLFLPVEMDHLFQRTILWIDECRRILYSRRIGLQVYQKKFGSDGAKNRAFRKLVRESRHDCWLISWSNSNTAIQQWCEESDVPTLVVGTRHAGCGLPHVMVDHQASGHHAAIRMIRAGHRRLAMLLDREGKLGDMECSAAFLKAARAHDGVVAELIHHNGTTDGVCNLVDRLVEREERPGAWLIADPLCYLAVHTRLMQRGVRIPDDISLVCRDADAWLASCIPEPGRYVFDPRKLARQVAFMAGKIASGASLTNKAVHILPEFVPGQTLLDCRKQGRSVNVIA
ncbi:MAG: GntR family transcriptional regulator [Opitutaceae bacterium]|jgi:DNA-binding LacI/PurR family transcriptional regulator|nr:GntR family transcriptional regulator [Opitutaceae bacterium]